MPTFRRRPPTGPPLSPPPPPPPPPSNHYLLLFVFSIPLHPPPPSPTPPVSIRDTNSSEAKPRTGSEAWDGRGIPREVIRHTTVGIRIPIPSGRKG
ncbi:hypothetical protein VPH35_060554 [Triticum aestivum]